MNIPASLNGLYASSVQVNTKKKWIIAVVGGDILLAHPEAKASNPIIDSDMAEPLSLLCQRKLTLGCLYTHLTLPTNREV